MGDSRSQWGRAGVGRGKLVIMPMVLIPLLAAIIVTSIPPAVATALAAGTPLRDVDWASALDSDPAVTVDPTVFTPPGETWPYVKVAVPGDRNAVLEGYALTDGVEFADLDGDGSEEAIIPVYSGGTAGLLGFMLYREATPAPRLVLVETGYKLDFTIEDRRLVIHRPNYVGFEPNCCPSSSTHTTTVLEGDKLVVVTAETAPNDVQEATVWAFYNALEDKRYEDAYAFLTPAFQAANPFDRWKAGYATTQSIDVQTSPGAVPTEVLIELTATDTRPGGGAVTHKYRGAWTLVWSSDQKRWLLDRARIEAA